MNLLRKRSSKALALGRTRQNKVGGGVGCCLRFAFLYDPNRLADSLEVNIAIKSDCPDGECYDPARQLCIPCWVGVEPNNDVVVSDLGFDDGSAYIVAPENYPEGLQVKITPGANINQKQYSKLQIFSWGEATSKEMIIGVGVAGPANTVDYYEPDGHWSAKLLLQNGIKQSFKFSPPANERPYYGSWSQCVAGYFNRMTDGSFIGAAFGLTCMVFGAECAIVISGSCAIDQMK